ncbi:5'-3' exonuclease H3TH domain-containing protein [Bacillaceae bacterium IKA-2]|nr:5'-3' exonuclease H3TH domain-containing protein [Bacillaceae bacterium IKA-2]
MAKGGYEPKKQTKNICMVMLPATEMSKATRASFQSLVSQLEKRFTGDQVVRNINLVDVSNMKNIILVIDSDPPVKVELNENQLCSGVTVNDFIYQLKQLEQAISKRNKDLILVSSKSNFISITYKPIIEVVPKQNKNIERLILIDGSNVLTTGYHATKKSMLKSSDGLYTNGVYIMAQKIMDIISRSNPSHLAICWDKGRDKTFRRKLYPEYKANRKESDPELKQQFVTAQKLFSNLGIAQYSHEEIEADDAIGTINAMWRREKGNSIVGMISNDKDLFQLLSENTSQLIRKGNDEQRITPDHLKEKFNITPEQWVDCKALLGDTSDNIPGVKGVGEKAVYPLIALHGNLETLFEKIDELKDSDFKRYFSKLQEGKDLAFLSKQLAKIHCEAENLLDISSLDDMKLSLEKSVITHHFKLLGFKTIVNSIDKGMYRIS